MLKGPWGDRKKPMSIGLRLLIGLGPMVLGIVGAIIWVNAIVMGYLVSDSLSLVLWNALIIGASLWAVYFLRRTSPHA
jgi:hypothetical protein